MAVLRFNHAYNKDFALIIKGNYMDYTLKCFKEDVEALFNHEHPEKFLDILADSPERFSFRIYTQNNVYHINARIASPLGIEGTLDCTVQSRRDTIGEDPYRSSSLISSKLEKKTWNIIRNNIIKYELLLVSHPTYKPLPPIVTAATLLGV